LPPCQQGKMFEARIQRGTRVMSKFFTVIFLD